MKLFVDTTTGTFGYADSVAFVDVPVQHLDWFGELSDSERSDIASDKAGSDVVTLLEHMIYPADDLADIEYKYTVAGTDFWAIVQHDRDGWYIRDGYNCGQLTAKNRFELPYMVVYFLAGRWNVESNRVKPVD